MESRDSSDGLRRRRECLDCSSRFTTYEKTHSLPLTVIKRDQSKEPFSLQKLETSLKIACAKRPVEEKNITEVMFEIKKNTPWIRPSGSTKWSDWWHSHK